MRAGLLRGDFSAAELTKAHLEHIKESNEHFNSFITICEDSALQSAGEADRIIKEQGSAAPELAGIPVAVKDMLVTKGIETTCGSRILKGFIPPYDCTAISRLKQNAAVIIGKTNMDEFAMGSSNEHSAFGPARNPWDTERVPGGTSGGSAIAVAAGQAPLALGTDTGGSIRQPAALVGVYGLKPTYGRVSRYGAVAHASSLDQIGPFARTVGDLARILGIIAGKDGRDSTSMDVPVPDYVHELSASEGNGLRGLRIGTPAEYTASGLEPEVNEAYRKSLAALSGLGAEIVDISLPHTEFALAAYYIIVPAEASSNLARYDGVRYGYRSPNGGSLSEMYEKTRAEGFGAEVKRRIMIGSYVLSAGYYDAYYRKAQQVRTLIINDFKAAFANHCDLIVTPTSPTTAFKLGEKLTSPLTMYLADIFTVPVNLAGLPALSLPCGISPANGMPIGLQLIGPPFAEAGLLKAADAFSKEIPVEGYLQRIRSGRRG
jgi:aspartyl-tRNA(Asn)/glutamyl-tRNA(Gln) amidotransferase subunit A